MQLAALSGAEQREIIRQVPSLSAKTLDDDQVRLLLSNPATVDPLFLLVALEELRGFAPYERLNERIAAFPREGDTVTAIFTQVIERLAEEFNPKLVETVLTLLASARRGLSERELQELVAGLAAADDLFPVLRQLRPYLLSRAGLIDFYHLSLARAVGECYLGSPTKKGVMHARLAEYFRDKPDWQRAARSGDARRANARKADELPWQLLQAEQWDGLRQCLTDIGFLEAKCAAGMTYALLEDFAAALKDWPGRSEDRREEDERTRQIDAYTGQLIAYARSWTGRVVSAALPVAPPSCRPWDSGPQDDTSSEENLAPRDQVRIFEQFIRSESHNLALFSLVPGFCAQQAHNFSAVGPAAHAAEAMLACGERPLSLLLHNCQRPRRTYPVLALTLDQQIPLAVTADASRALVRSVLSSEVALWNLRTARPIRHLDMRTPGTICMTPDGRLAIIADPGGTLHVWDLECGVCLRSLVGHSGAITAMSNTPDGGLVVSAGDDRTLRVWNAVSGQCVKVFDSGLSGGLESAPASLYAIALTPDGRTAVSLAGAKDPFNARTKVCIWDLEGRSPPRDLTGPAIRRGYFTGLSLLASKGCVAACGGSLLGEVAIWDLKDGRHLQTLENVHVGFLNAMGLSDNGRLAVVCGWDGVIRVLDLDSGQCLKVFENSSPIDSCFVSADGRWAVTGDCKGILRVWDVQRGQSGRAVEDYPVDPDKLRDAKLWNSAVALVPGGGRAVSGGNAPLRVWDVATGRPVGVFCGHENWVHQVAVMPGAGMVLSGSDDETIRLWDIGSGQCLKTMQCSTGRGTWSMSPDGTLLASSCVWDLVAGRRLWKLWGSTAAITPDGGLVVAPGAKHDLEVFNVRSGRCERNLRGHGADVDRAVVTPDGRQVVAAGSDGTIRVWDLASGECRQSFTGHRGRVTALAVTGDGHHVVSGSEDRTLRVWDLSSGLQSVAPTPAAILAVAVQGETVAVGCKTTNILFFRFSRSQLGRQVATAVRVFDHRRGQWGAGLSSSCGWCGQAFAPPGSVGKGIFAIAMDARGPPDQSPCIALPASAWDDLRLLAECPSCHGTLRFNPFIVDNQRQT